MYATLLSTMITASHALYYMEARILLGKHGKKSVLLLFTVPIFMTGI